MSQNKPAAVLQYSDPDDRREVIVNELTKILSVLLGLGAVPLLERRVDWFWAAGLAAGVLAVGVGLFFIYRRARRRRKQAVDPGGRAGLRARLQNFGRAVGRAFGRAWAWIKSKWPFRRRAAAAPETGEDGPPAAGSPAAAPSEPAPTNGMMAVLRGDATGTVILLPYLTLWIGIFIFIPSVVAALLQRMGYLRTDLVLVYFSAPALLVWIGGEGFYFFPRFSTRPRRAPEILGILKSLLIVLSAALLWIFLGLEIGTPGVDWLHRSAIGLAVAGAILGLAAEGSRRSSLRERERGQTHPDLAEEAVAGTALPPAQA